MSVRPLVLASQSSYRRELLSRLNLTFSTLPSSIDESSSKENFSSMNELARSLAKEKALDVFNKKKESLIIGSDQVIGNETQIFSKPGNIDKAFKQLKLMSGKSHKLITAVCLKSVDILIQFENMTILKVRELSDKEIMSYLKRDQPFDCAGSYKIEGAGISLFEEIQMSDFTSIIGLPLIQLTTELKKLGYSLH